MVQPIWQVLTDLGIEGEYCRSAVDAVERVTTQMFQIVITDWEDQPEATFLLKTARDQKAAQRPLTLAIVGDDGKLPEALQAGANSVLVRPILPEQVRETMTTACELLRAKSASQPPSRVAQTLPPPRAQEAVPAPLAAAAAAASSSAPPSPTATSAPQEAEKVFRAGEFLNSAGSTPSAQFVTECDVQKSMDHAAASEVDALTELEPMASAVAASAPEVSPPQTALDGWAALQARITKSNEPSAPAPPRSDVSAKNSLLEYGETPSFSSATATPVEQNPQGNESQHEAESEANLFSYMEGEESQATRKPKRSRKGLVLGLAVAILLLAAVPQTRHRFTGIYRNSAHAGKSWLNPQPVQVAPAVTQHESFGQEGDEYKLPVEANIPDATTDPSQIRVLPVVDPTAKPTKASDPATAQTTGENPSVGQGQSGTVEAGQSPVAEGQIKAAEASSPVDLTIAAPQGVGQVSQPQSNPPQSTTPVSQETPQRPLQAPVPRQTFSSNRVPSGTDSAIPSSLRSQTASMTPEASGAKPLDAAMSSIEPVRLPETAVWSLLVQPLDPVYPDAAKASKQRGVVVLQVLIGREGTVQDAKFLQGSLVFARSAIEAVKQWRFKPYTLNGRPVSVQSVITLNFKPSS
jgi:TonB family protein